MGMVMVIMGQVHGPQVSPTIQIGNSLIRVDALVGLLAVEEIGNKSDDTMGNTSGTTDKDDFMDVRPVGPVDLGIAENLLNGFKSTTEESLAELFETGTSEGSVEVNTVEELGYA